MSRKIKQYVVGSMLLLCVLMLSSCSDSALPLAEETEQLRFEIFRDVNSNYGMFRHRYTSMFERLHPELEVEYVSHTPHYMHVTRDIVTPTDDRLELLEQWLDKTNADVLVFDFADFELLLKSDVQAFEPLDPWIKQSKWDISDLTPAAVEAFRHPTDRQLYAISPTYGHPALIYNVDAFQAAEADVSFPEEQMTWDEIFSLAKKVASGSGRNRLYGFAFSPQMGTKSFHEVVNKYAFSKQMLLYNDDGEMLVTSEEWRELWTEMSQMFDAQVIPSLDKLGDGSKEWFNFFNGHAAMALISYSDLVEALQTSEIPFAWDLVVAPEYAGSRGEYVFAIRANAENSYNAWKFLDFMLSEDWAQIHGREGLLSIREDFWPKDVDDDLSVFVQHAPPNHPHLMQQDSRMYYDVYSQGSYAWDRHHSHGSLTVEQMLEEWEKTGNDLLRR